MTSTEDNTGVPDAANADYLDIIQSNVKVDKQFVGEEGVPAKINYYCRKCKKIVSAQRIGKKLSFKCGECGEENIPFGSELSIHNYYKVHKKEQE